MKRVGLLFALLLTACLAMQPLRAQDAKKPEPKPAPSPSEALLEQWNDIGRKLIAMAEDFPEDKYGYKPAPESRTFKANLVHASGSMYYFTDIAQGKKPRYPDAYENQGGRSSVREEVRAGWRGRHQSQG